MAGDLPRRDFLKASAAVLGTAACGSALGAHRHAAHAAPTTVPEVDALAIRVLIDSAQDIFLAPQKVGGVEMQRVRGRGADFRRTLHNQWGLSLLLESGRGGEMRSTLLDFGYTPEALLNNMELLGVDAATIGALVVSHGHYDHFGGLVGFLEKHRAQMPADLTLTIGGEEALCKRWQRTPTPGQFAEWGVLDTGALERMSVRLAKAETPTVIGGHAFTTGAIQRKSFEKVLPNTMVEYAKKDGLGCDASHFTSAELQGKIVPDEHHHEHATCFNLKGRGLVVISSCGHAGIVNSVRQAQEVSGVRKVHAVLGGFHLGPAPPEYIAETVSALKALDPDVVVPMHCSGVGFTEEVRRQMPDRLLLSSTGSRLVFGV
jgi:7,8-dihydropterin-6-yl-methyl-4-(beta-D-ribofuranosyl)aminobenzene 5'-phosphate synthase